MQVNAPKRTLSKTFMNFSKAEQPMKAKTHKERTSIHLVITASIFPENHLVGEVILIDNFILKVLLFENDAISDKQHL